MRNQTARKAFCSVSFRFRGINLRFYVRREVQEEIRHGVVFIAEIVPRLAIAKTARWFYAQNYVSRKPDRAFVAEGSGVSVFDGQKIA